MEPRERSTRPHHGRRLGRACCLATMLALTPSLALGGARIRVVDVNVNRYTEPDVVCAPNGDFLVVYRHDQQQALKLARVTPSSTTLSVLDADNFHGYAPSAAIDSLGLLSVAHAGLSGGIYYTLDGGDLFGLTTILAPGTDTGRIPMLAMDSADRPFVAFQANQSIPSLAKFDIPSGKWLIDVVPGSPMSTYPINVAVDSQDQPVVLYHTYDNSLELATLTPGGWTLRKELLRASPGTSGISLGLDTADAAHVALTDGGYLIIVRLGPLGMSYVYAPVPPTPAIIGPHAMSVDHTNGINVAYFDPSQNSISVVTRTALWSTTQVEAPLEPVMPALTVDSLHRWVVAYVDLARGQLKVSAKGWWDFARPDFNDDGHVDGLDLEHFDLCMTGPTVKQDDLINCSDADLDYDGDVDQADFGVFQACYSGPDLPADPTCADDPVP